MGPERIAPLAHITHTWDIAEAHCICERKDFRYLSQCLYFETDTISVGVLS